MIIVVDLRRVACNAPPIATEMMFQKLVDGVSSPRHTTQMSSPSTQSAGRRGLSPSSLTKPPEWLQITNTGTVFDWLVKTGRNPRCELISRKGGEVDALRRGSRHCKKVWVATEKLIDRIGPNLNLHR